MDEQAIAARLTAIAEKCERNSDSLLVLGNDYSDVLLDAALVMREASAHVETLTQQVAELTVDRDAFKDSEREALKVVAQQYAWRVEAQQAATKAEQQRDAAHAALTTWGRHDPVCDAEAWEARNRYFKPNYPRPTCTCKLDAALAASAPQKEKT